MADFVQCLDCWNLSDPQISSWRFPTSTNTKPSRVYLFKNLPVYLCLFNPHFQTLVLNIIISYQDYANTIQNGLTASGLQTWSLLYPVVTLNKWMPSILIPQMIHEYREESIRKSLDLIFYKHIRKMLPLQLSGVHTDISPLKWFPRMSHVTCIKQVSCWENRRSTTWRGPWK